MLETEAVRAPVAVAVLPRVKPKLPRVPGFDSSVTWIGIAVDALCVSRPFPWVPSCALTRSLMTSVRPSSVWPVESVDPLRIVFASSTGWVSVLVPPNR